ncbi:hypothetical protein M8J76_013633 [Diaphorina citri]|nr:hypothetical protein M8J76_013633 [Diaphorina citri]
MDLPKDPFDYLDSHESCYMCNGYYGPNFNEPVCSTCHLFLFPDDLSQEQPDLVLSCIKDDGNDSGNDCDCPQDRDNSIKTPPLSCCSYNNLAGNGPSGAGHSGAGGNNPGGGMNAISRRRARQRRRAAGEEQEDEAESSDSLTSDEELPVVPARHYVFNAGAAGGGGYHQQDDNHPVPPVRENNLLYDEVDNELEEGDDLPAPQNNPDEPELQRRIEELSAYNKNNRAVLTSQNTGGSSIHSLPPEVLITVFSYLDDLSLCSVSRACTRWFTIIADLISSDQWRYFVLTRFPLFNSNITVFAEMFILTSFYRYSVYAKLVESTPCYTCLQHMIRPDTSSLQEDNTWRHFRLRKEYNDIKLDPPDGIQAQPLDNKRCHWMATIAGPVASPYEGGVFYLYIRIPFSYPMHPPKLSHAPAQGEIHHSNISPQCVETCYPMHPPKVKFITRIFHPNVSRHGDVGIDCIQHNWSLALTLNKVLISVQSLLTDPYCLVCMEPSIGELYVNNRRKFDEYARSWTRKYAILDTVLIPV